MIMSLKEIKRELRRSREGSKLHLTPEEEREFLRKYKSARKITLQRLMTQMSKKDSKFPQPVRTQPVMEIFTSKDNDYSIAQRIVKLTAKDVKRWGDLIIADLKVDGARALLIVDPKKRDVRILSRRLKPFKKFREKYKEMILESLSPLVKDQSVFDAELYALSKDGKVIPGHVVSGWIRNPNDEKYSNIKPSVQVFDIVMFNKKDLRGLPLKYRKRLLEIALRDSGILQVADTRRMKNSSRLIDWLFNSKVKKRGFEGLVLKDPESIYFYGKPKNNPWKKVKSVDSLDLRLVATEAYPSDKPFRFYKHWRMSPQDSEMIVKADKAIKAAGFNNDFYIDFTKKLLDKWRRGEIRADESAGMVKVDERFRDIYGVSEVPRKLILGDKGPIVELFVEKMSETLQPSGTKIVRIRDDKEVADTLEDMLQLKNLLLGRGR